MIWPTALAIMLTLAVSGCGTRDHFPMKNPATGQEVICHSGWYFGEEGAPQVRIAMQCIRSCNQYGFYRIVEGRYESLDPHAPDEDVKPSIPSECLR